MLSMFNTTTKRETTMKMSEYDKARKEWLDESLPLKVRSAAGERMDREARRENEELFSRLRAKPSPPLPCPTCHQLHIPWCGYVR
jgi:hypothetical protein